MMTVMPNDKNGGERSYRFDTMLTMIRRKPYNCITKREIGTYIESEEEVP